jgi:hypothetical protein
VSSPKELPCSAPNPPSKSTANQAPRISNRGWLEASIRQHAINGEVAIIESGRDCDGVQYAGKRRVIPATLLAYYELRDNIANWADGPFHLRIERPDVIIEYESRDLVMEAHENGHPHAIYPSFP